MAFNTLSAGPEIELSYIDSGEPASGSPYTTIVAIHGVGFSNLIFKKLLPVAQRKGARVVALNRRHYPGSTKYSAEELGVINDGTDTQTEAEFQARGLEIATFINNFIMQYNLPPISEDRKTGGIILVGWSFGSVAALATISNAHLMAVLAWERTSEQCLPMVSRYQNYTPNYLMNYLKLEPHPTFVGFPVPKQSWSLIQDIPEALRMRAFGQWITAYFDHGDIAKQDPDALEWVIPSPDYVPTLFKIPAVDRAELVRYGEDGLSDLSYIANFGRQFKASYRKAIHDPETFRIFPALKYVILAGVKSVAFSIAAAWAVENDITMSGSTRVKVRMVPDINHFWHWEDPERALDCFLAC